jgi:predicted dehydrogenase
MHLAFALRDDVAVVGLADPDEAGRARFAKESGALRTYADYHAMLEQERPDLVAIGPRHTTLHKDYLLACADVGAHGLIEKPLCTDLAEADAMVATIEAKNLKWSIGFNFRALPPIQHAKKAIREGVIGTVLELRGRGKEDARAGGEDLAVLGPHLFDLMAFMMDGPPEWCCANISQDGKTAVAGDVREATEPLGPVVGDCVHAVFGFKGGAGGHFDSVKNPEGNGGRFGLDVFGSRGVISIRYGALPTVHWLDDPAWAPGLSGAAWKPLPGAPDFAFGNEVLERNKCLVDDLIAAIEQDRRPAVSLQDGRTAQEMVQAVNEAHIRGGRVTMPLIERVHPLKRWLPL